jgi:hypothetical protein
MGLGRQEFIDGRVKGFGVTQQVRVGIAEVIEIGQLRVGR